MTRFLFIFVLLLTKIAFFSGVHAEESTVSAGEQKTYEFTQYFNRKFKTTLGQQRAFEVSGSSASSTLGPTSLGGGKAQFDANYWGFINDLQSSTGNQSANTTSAPTCNGMIITSIPSSLTLLVNSASACPHRIGSIFSRSMRLSSLYMFFWAPLKLFCMIEKKHSRRGLVGF